MCESLKTKTVRWRRLAWALDLRLTRDLEFTVSMLQAGGAGSSNANDVPLLSCGVCRDAYARWSKVQKKG